MILFPLTPLEFATTSSIPHRQDGLNFQFCANVRGAVFPVWALANYDKETTQALKQRTRKSSAPSEQDSS